MPDGRSSDITSIFNALILAIRLSNGDLGIPFRPTPNRPSMMIWALAKALSQSVRNWIPMFSQIRRCLARRAVSLPLSARRMQIPEQWSR